MRNKNEKLMGNFIGKFEASVLPTMTVFERNQYPFIRTTPKYRAFKRKIKN